MTVTSTTLKTIAQGNGATTVFSYNFLIPAATQVQVTYTDALGNQTVLTTSQYTITGIGAAAGGTVTYPLTGPAIAAGTTLTIMRLLPLTQTKQITNQGAFYPQTVSDALDFIVMQLQQINDEFARALLTPVTEPSTNLTIPMIAQRKNQLLGFDGSGNAIAAQPSSALVSSAMQPVASAATLALGRTALGLGVLATLGIGAGLRNDGASNLQASSVVSAVATNQAPVAADHRTQFYATGNLTFTLARANTLWSGYEITVTALTDSITFTPNAADTFFGGSSGTAVVFPIGSVVRIWTNAAASGTWYFNVTTQEVVFPQGYLSNSATQKVLLNDVTAATTITYWPDVGNSVPINNGVAFVPYIFPKLTLTLNNPAHAINQLYDVFAILSGGEPILATGPAWRQPGISITGATNASPIVITANAHGLSNGDVVYISGVQGNTAANGFWTVASAAANTFALTGSTGNAAYTAATGIAASRGNGASTTQLAVSPQGLNTNAVAMTAQNGATTYSVPISQGTYLGTISIDGTVAQVSCHKTYGQSRKWGVWNAFNRKVITLIAGDPTASWTYSTNTIRAANGSALNSLTVLIGLPEEVISASLTQLVNSGGNGVAGTIGIGDGGVTTAMSGTRANVQATSASVAIQGTVTAAFDTSPFIGLRQLSALETGNGTSTATFNGTQTNMLLRAVSRG